MHARKSSVKRKCTSSYRGNVISRNLQRGRESHVGRRKKEPYCAMASRKFALKRVKLLIISQGGGGGSPCFSCKGGNGEKEKWAQAPCSLREKYIISEKDLRLSSKKEKTSVPRQLYRGRERENSWERKTVELQDKGGEQRGRPEPGKASAHSHLGRKKKSASVCFAETPATLRKGEGEKEGEETFLESKA